MWWQNHFDIKNLKQNFDIIRILTIWHQDYKKEKEELKETMALKVVTDGKNDNWRGKKNDKEYVHNKRTQDRTCVLCATFCINR